MLDRMKCQRGLSYIEMMVTATVLIVLASAAVPLYKWDGKRRKEVKLRTHLRQMRTAIDLYKEYSDEGRILQEDVEQMGYPVDLEALVEGVTVAPPIMNNTPGGAGQQGMSPSRLDRNDDFGETTDGVTVKFLVRIPVDPITGEAVWGMRSYQDDFDSDTWGEENLYDVYSLSDKKALDGTYYNTW